MTFESEVGIDVGGRKPDRTLRLSNPSNAGQNLDQSNAYRAVPNFLVFICLTFFTICT